MAVDPHEAHTLESRKEGDVRNSIWQGTSLLGVTRRSTIVARAPMFQEVARINYEVLHEALWAGIAPSTHC